MPRKDKSDTFDLWKRSGALESKLGLISDLTARRSSQIVISQQLGINPKTFSMLKNKHSEIRKAVLEGEERLRSAILDAVYKGLWALRRPTRLRLWRSSTRGRRRES